MYRTIVQEPMFVIQQ